jgi:hypothetical protein
MSSMMRFKLSLLLAVPVVVIAFVLFNKHWGLLRHNAVTELAAERGHFFPEELVPGEWAFWCMSGKLESIARQVILDWHPTSQRRINPNTWDHGNTKLTGQDGLSYLWPRTEITK